jgi:hypothetical protein
MTWIDGGSLWGMMTVVGPIIIIAVLMWAMLRNRTLTRAEKERSEQATRELYEESDRASKARDGE